MSLSKIKHIVLVSVPHYPAIITIAHAFFAGSLR